MSLEDKAKSDFRISKKAKDSWQFFSNLKSMKNLNGNKSLENTHSYFFPYSNNLNYAPTSSRYSIIKINSSPKLKDNINEINTIIRRRKLEKDEYFLNIFNNILINESKKFRNNIYITGGGINTMRKNSQSIIFDINKNNGTLSKNKKYISYFDNNSSDNPNINVDTGLNSNSLNNESNCLNDTKKNCNHSQTQYSLVSKYSNNFNNIKKKKNVQPLSKIRMEINDLIFNNDYKLRGEFTKLEKNIIKFKKFKIY